MESYLYELMSILLLLLICTTTESNNNFLKLGNQKKKLGTIKVLNFEPAPEDFYRDFVRQSIPVLIRTRNPSWHNYLNEWKTNNFLRKHHGNLYGRAYKRTIWTKHWPVEVRSKFSDFLDKVSSQNLYWDSEFPLNSSILQSVPLPLSLACATFRDSIASGSLLYTNRNSSSVFHHDGSENFFFQISGKKTWLIANHSYSKHVYANLYDTQAGMSPINPENVDLQKYPLASDIDFYEIVTEPGDFLYIPEYWWHQVRSFDAPIIAVNIWAEIFNYPNLESVKDVVEYTEKFAQLRQSEQSSITCSWEKTSLFDVHVKTWNSLFEPLTKSPQEIFPIYFGSDEGAFYSVSSLDGKVIWKYKLEEDAGSTPVQSNKLQTVFFAGEDSAVYAFNTESGKLRWKTLLKDGVAAALMLANDEKYLIVCSLDRYVYVINTKLGNIVWKQGPFGGELWATPRIFQNGIVISVVTEKALHQPTVFYLDLLEGKIIWNYTTDGSVFSTPAVDTTNKIVYVICSKRQLHAVDMNTGKKKWKLDVEDECESSPVLDPRFNKLYLVTLSGTVKCIDLIHQQEIWKKEFSTSHNENVMSSPLLSWQYKVLYAAIDNKVYALKAETGNVLWTFHASGSFISSPRMDKYGIIYVGSNDHNLYAIDSKDGKQLWSAATRGPIISSVTMDGKYVDYETSGALL